MKYFELAKEEEKMLADFESCKFESVKNVAREKAGFRSAVTAMLKKSKNINIRLSEHDLLKIKAKALTEGIPYQTYVASLVHKNLNS